MEFFNLLMDDRMIIIFEKLPLFFVFFVFIFAQDFLCWTVLHFTHDYLSIDSESSPIYILDMTDFQIGDWRPSNLSPSASAASLHFYLFYNLHHEYIQEKKKVRKQKTHGNVQEWKFRLYQQNNSTVPSNLTVSASRNYPPQRMFLCLGKLQKGENVSCLLCVTWCRWSSFFCMAER